MKRADFCHHRRKFYRRNPRQSIFFELANELGRRRCVAQFLRNRLLTLAVRRCNSKTGSEVVRHCLWDLRLSRCCRHCLWDIFCCLQFFFPLPAGSLLSAGVVGPCCLQRVGLSKIFSFPSVLLCPVFPFPKNKDTVPENPSTGLLHQGLVPDLSSRTLFYCSKRVYEGKREDSWRIVDGGWRTAVPRAVERTSSSV